MAKHTVNVPEHTSGFRKMTAGQWLTEFRQTAAGEGKTRVFNLPAPVRVTIVGPDERTRETKICRTSTELFGMLHRPGLVFAVSWRGQKLGPLGVYQLNQAINTAAVRQGGSNIVRHWLENRKGTSVPLGCDFAALLSFLEIRPLSTGKTSVQPSRPLYIMSNILLSRNQRLSSGS